MSVSLDVALSAQLSLMKRLDTIAHNVANASTAGFRAEEIDFKQFVSSTTLDPTAFALAGQTYLSRASGPMIRTDGAFDVAVNGEGWLAIQTPAGVAYTRDGRMKMTEEGDLQTLNGYPVLDIGGAPLALNPNGGSPLIASDGMISQNGQQVGALGLFRIDPEAQLRRSRERLKRLRRFPGRGDRA